MQITVPDTPLRVGEGAPLQPGRRRRRPRVLRRQGGFGADGEIVDGGFEAQLRQAFVNIKTALESAGSSLEGIVKLNVFLVNPDDYGSWRTVRSEFMTPPYPAATAISSALLLPGMLVELEAVGVRGATRA